MWLFSIRKFKKMAESRVIEALNQHYAVYYQLFSVTRQFIDLGFWLKSQLLICHLLETIVAHSRQIWTQAPSQRIVLRNSTNLDLVHWSSRLTQAFPASLNYSSLFLTMIAPKLISTSKDYSWLFEWIFQSLFHTRVALIPKGKKAGSVCRG